MGGERAILKEDSKQQPLIYIKDGVLHFRNDSTYSAEEISAAFRRALDGEMGIVKKGE